MADAGGTTRLAVHLSVVASIAATLGLLHFLLFAFESRDRRNLFLALLAGAFALVVVLDYRERIGAEVVLPVVGPLQRWAVSAVILAGVRFAYSLFHDRAPRRFTGYVAAILFLLVLSRFDTRLFDVPAGLLGLVVTLDALLCVLRGWRRLEPEAWIVALGSALFCVGGLAQLGLDLAGSPVLGDDLAPYLWGGLALLVASSIYLARVFARTRRELERRLIEVEELSAQKLAQERAAREEEVRRRLVEAENERRRDELEAARRLQLRMLPAALPELEDGELAATVVTATERGGDYYDDATTAEGGLWMALGDAVGHGARAGTLVTVAKSLFTGITTQPSPAVALERFDERLRGMGLQRAHLALTLARHREGVVEVAAAGTPPTLVRRRDGRVEEIEFESLPLGSPLRQSYAGRTIELAPGDVVLLLSDGFAELPGPGGEPLGYDRVREIVAATGLDGSLQAWLESLVRVHLGTVSPPDDVTLVALRVGRP